ncbi:hypothetical protein R6Q59_010873 [Mikania micrantha]
MSPKSRSRFQRCNCQPRKGEVFHAIKKKHSINAHLYTLIFFVHKRILGVSVDGLMQRFLGFSAGVNKRSSIGTLLTYVGQFAGDQIAIMKNKHRYFGAKLVLIKPNLKS